MATDTECAACGTDDDVVGRPVADGLLELTCERCGARWTRDPSPSCPTCGGRDLEAAPRLLVEKSRGTQMSIQGVQREFLCRVCDADRLGRRREGYLPDRLPGSQ